jgi:hypothetical protein
MLKLATTPMPDLRRIRTLPLPLETPNQVDGWSKPLGTLVIPGQTRIGRWIAVIILTIVGLVTLAPPVAFLFEELRRGETLLGVFLIAALYLSISVTCFYAAGRLFLSRPRLGLTMWIFEEGMMILRGGDLTVARWEEVPEYEMSNETGRPLFWLTLENEAPIILSVGHCPEVIPLMEYMEIRMASAQFLPRLKALWDDDQLIFDAIRLDRKGIEGPRFFAPWNSVRRVMADGRFFYLECEGESRWHEVRFRDVSFPNLVIALAHVMIEEHTRFPVS